VFGPRRKWEPICVARIQVGTSVSRAADRGEIYGSTTQAVNPWKRSRTDIQPIFTTVTSGSNGRCNRRLSMHGKFAGYDGPGPVLGTPNGIAAFGF